MNGKFAEALSKVYWLTHICFFLLLMADANVLEQGENTPTIIITSNSY